MRVVGALPPAGAHSRALAWPLASSKRSAVLQGRGHGGHQHRLLGIRRAAQAAGAEVPAALDVALDGGGRDAQLGGAPAQQVVVLVRRGEPGPDREAALRLLEVGCELVVAEIGQREMPPPVLQRGGGGAERARPVDRGGPAHAAALQDVDGLVARLARGALLVERGIGLGLQLVEIAAAAQRTFLDDHDFQAGLGEQFRRDAAARAGADDGDVADQPFRHGAVGATGDFPAAAQSVGNGVGQPGHVGSIAGPG